MKRAFAAVECMDDHLSLFKFDRVQIPGSEIWSELRSRLGHDYRSVPHLAFRSAIPCLHVSRQEITAVVQDSERLLVLLQVPALFPVRRQGKVQFHGRSL